MGIASSIGKIIGGILIVIFLSSLVVSHTLANSTTNEELKPVFEDFVGSQLAKNGELNQSEAQQFIYENCRNQDSITLDFGGQIIVLDCSELRSIEPSELTKYIAGKMFDVIYYKKYDCSGYSCFSLFLKGQGMEKAVIISEQMNQFFHKVVLYSIIGLIIGVLLVVISIRKVFGIVKTIGASFVIAGIGFLPALVIKNIFPASGFGSIGEFIIKTMDTIITLYIIVLIIGMTMFIIGYLGNRKHETNEPQRKKSKKTSKK